MLANARELDEVVDPDLKEGWMVGPRDNGEEDEYWGRFGHGANVFPSEDQVQGMREVMGQYALSFSLLQLVIQIADCRFILSSKGTTLNS